MIQSIQPREYFPIGRKLADPFDATTYYVRAVVTNARTAAAIATLNLVDLTGGLFVYSWQVPADASGQGTYINVKTTVYIDSGYTTKSENHSEELETYLILDRNVGLQLLANQLSALSTDIDYDKIKKIISKAVREIIKDELSSLDIPKEADLKPIVDAVLALPDLIKIPKQKEVNLSPVISAIEAVQKLVDSLPRFEKQDPQDLGPIVDTITKALDAFQKINNDLMVRIGKSGALIEGAVADLPKFQKTFEELSGAVKDMGPIMAPTMRLFGGAGKKEEKEGPKPRLNSFGKVVKR